MKNISALTCSGSGAAVLPLFAWTILAAISGLGASAAVPYLDHPPPGATGGFDEPTCQECHSGHPLNDPGGRLTIIGVPERYAPGRLYPLTIMLERPRMGRAGFQMSVRFAEGEHAGEQAGDLRPRDGRVEVVSEPSGPQYANHTEQGARIDSAGDPAARWSVDWTAPERARGTVLIHVAANAANYDDSELGDFIYTRAARTIADSELYEPAGVPDPRLRASPSAQDSHRPDRCR